MTFILASVINEAQNGANRIHVPLPPRFLWSKRHVCDVQLGYTARSGVGSNRRLVAKRGIRSIVCCNVGRRLEKSRCRQRLFHNELEIAEAAWIDKLAGPVYVHQLPDPGIPEDRAEIS